MRRYIVEVAGILILGALSGCGTWQAYRVDKGESDGIEYCRKGKADKSPYYGAFYDAFLLENLRKGNK